MFLSGPAAAAGIATINSIGNLGGFVGPMMIGVIRQQTGSYTWGLYFVAGLLALSALIVLILSARADKPQFRFQGGPLTDSFTERRVIPD